MANLTTGRRAGMSQSQFAGPNKSFPVNDATHQRLAIGGDTRSYNAGNISKSQENHIKARAESLLHGSAHREPRSKMTRA